MDKKERKRIKILFLAQENSLYGFITYMFLETAMFPGIARNISDQSINCLPCSLLLKCYKKTFHLQCHPHYHHDYDNTHLHNFLVATDIIISIYTPSIIINNLFFHDPHSSLQTLPPSLVVIVSTINITTYNTPESSLYCDH